MYLGAALVGINFLAADIIQHKGEIKTVLPCKLPLRTKGAANAGKVDIGLSLALRKHRESHSGSPWGFVRTGEEKESPYTME